MCWGMGILISSAVVRAVVNVPGDLGKYSPPKSSSGQWLADIIISLASAICLAMVLARASLLHRLLRSRLALVPRPTRKTRRSQSQSHSPARKQQYLRNRHRRNPRVDRAHHSTGESRDCRRELHRMLQRYKSTSNRDQYGYMGHPDFVWECHSWLRGHVVRTPYIRRCTKG